MLADAVWCLIFSTTKVVNLNTFSSDHSTIFLDFPVPIFHKKEKRFRFESAWLNHDDCDSLV